jgi:hypothetical protein
MKLFNFMCPAPLRARLRSAVKKTGLMQAEICRRALDEHLRQYEPRQARQAQPEESVTS